ncbi:MAG TPA: hypothetical protein VEH77_20210 [Roseiarcus sp.]|nr:hypothetical protein [Roseiarcus sp.]
MAGRASSASSAAAREARSLTHGRDRKPVVVSRDLTNATSAAAIAPTLQAALDSWAEAAPRLAAWSTRFWRRLSSAAKISSSVRRLARKVPNVSAHEEWPCETEEP